MIEIRGNLSKESIAQKNMHDIHKKEGVLFTNAVTQ